MHWFTRPGWPGNLLALLAGTLTTLSLSPFDIWPLALLSVALLYLGLRESGPKQAAQRGWCYGFGLFASGEAKVTSALTLRAGVRYSHDDKRDTIKERDWKRDKARILRERS